MDAFSSVIARLAKQGPSSEHDKPLRISLEPEGALTVDRALAIAVAHGPAVAGLPHDEHGFLPVDAHAHLAGSDRIFVAGDATALTLKHSTLASTRGRRPPRRSPPRRGRTSCPRSGRTCSTGS